jgi:GDP-6-deoxy-D-talose 4-dehydrogenase
MAGAKVLITGADGFTGAHLARELLAAGYDVAGTVFGEAVATQPMSAHPPFGQPLIACDLTSLPSARGVVDSVRPDYLVHLAGLSFVGHTDPQAFYSVNLFGTLNLLQAIHDAGLAPRKILIPSSANVYGNAQREVLGEDVCPRPVNHYAASKLAMEHMVATWFDRLPIVITRPFNYSGPGQSPDFLIPKIINHFVARTPRIELGNLDVEREFSDVRSVCRSYRLLLESADRGQVFNVCSGHAYSLRQILEAMARIAGYSIEVDVNPALVRANEIKRLSGSNAKLHRAIGEQVYPPIEQMLRWMYETKAG